jgi:dTDP-4-dehydrorhamnose reductase
MPPRILLTGATGQVGDAIRELLTAHPPLDFEVFAPGRTDLDLTNEASIRAAVRDVQPDWIVNPAAYTAVDKAESDRDAAFAINAEAPRILGEEAARIGARVIHFSTDYVFDGSSDRPYTEQDPTGPQGVYGASKLAGEKALAATGAAHIILRTSWVYGATGKNFLLTVLRVARERPEMNIVADQHGAPTAARDLARLTGHLLNMGESGAKPHGVYHATGAGETTWHGFATEALRLASERQPNTAYARLLPIPTSEYPTPARRPANSRLNCERLAAETGWRFPAWQASLAEVMDELEQAKSALDPVRLHA